MNEDAVKLEARISAIEYLLCQYWVNILKFTGITQAKLDASHADLIGRLGRQTFPGLDAAQSDLAASEFEAAVRAILAMQREMLGFPKLPKADQG
jgi:hypothetical protein